jgi:RNA polymerase sigma-70 factor, ECF subfamily
MSTDGGMPTTPTPKSDLELIGLIAQKDESALAELFKRFQSRVTNLCYRYVGNRDDAEIMTQDVFLKIWGFAGSFRGSSQVWTWIYRIAVNLCLTFKAHKRQPIDELGEDVPANTAHQPEVAHVRDEQQVIIEQALDSLPPDQKMAIVLSRYEGMSYLEIGEAMNKSRTAVATLLYRAREELKRKLEPFVKKGKLSP